jgi:hypothetical protein
MATTPLKVWIIDPANAATAPKLDTTPRYVNIGPVDLMKQQAKEHLARANFKTRSVNHTVDGELVAYCYAAELVAPSASKPQGWIFKRTSVPSHK